MTGNTRGPEPEWVITPEVIEKISEMAGIMTHQQMYHYFGVSKSTWYRRIAESPETLDIIKKGKPKKILKAANCLLDAMTRGGKEAVTAAIFYLKTQAGWSEKQKVELSQKKKLPELPDNLGKDPIEASRIYQKIMGGK